MAWHCEYVWFSLQCVVNKLITSLHRGVDLLQTLFTAFERMIASMRNELFRMVLPFMVSCITPMTVFKKLAIFHEIIKFLNVFGLIETLANFLMAH